jgi:hypothetical protein
MHFLTRGVRRLLLRSNRVFAMSVGDVCHGPRSYTEHKIDRLEWEILTCLRSGD